MLAKDEESGRCYACGSTAPWIILIAGEDEHGHEEWACTVHARGHWRWALVTPPPEETAADRDVRLGAW